jgi:hypothetical protein
MRKRLWAVVLIVPGMIGFVSTEELPKQGKDAGAQEVSFKTDVLPTIKKYCLPCHDEESFNRSELALDSYELIIKGGKHGPAVVPGKPSESILIQKLGANPPFGDPMPLKSKRQRTSDLSKKLTPDEVNRLSKWVEQGAKNN